MHAYELLRGPMRLWYARMLSYAPMTPSPRTAPTMTVGNGNPDQVLLIGNGPLHGWGVMSHGISVIGHLGHELWRRTSRPTRIDFVGDERMTAASATAWLGDQLDVEYDVIVIALGMNDALRLEPVRGWTSAVQRLLDRVRANSAPSTPIVLVELPHMRSYAMANSLLGTVAQLHARRLNTALHRFAACSSRISVIPAPTEFFDSDRPLGSSETHQHWAQQLSSSLAPVLDAIRKTRPARPAAARAHHEWSGTEQALAAAELPGGDAKLTAITQRAQAHFGVALAAINLIDSDRAWFVANTGGAPMSMPSELAYCSTTVSQDEPLVIPNSRHDTRYRNNPFLDVVKLPFYAGIPLHDSRGRAIGTMCLLDSSAHDSTFAPLADLQLYADEAEFLLQAMEPERRPTSMPLVPVEV